MESATVSNPDAVASRRDERVRPVWRDQRANQLGVCIEVCLQVRAGQPCNLPLRISTFDPFEKPSKFVRVVVAASRRRMYERPEFFEMAIAVVTADEAPARSEYAGDLGEASIQIREVVEHPVSDDDIELTVAEWQRSDIRKLSGEPTRPRRLHGCWRQINAQDGRSRDEHCQLAGAAANIENPLRACFCDRGEHCFDWFAGLSEPARPVKPANAEPIELGVFRADEIGIV
jgi:hypothetical protein